MSFLFEALPAKYGDCLYLTFDDADGRRLRLLVDGGPGQVFEKFLEPRLQGDRANLDPDEPLVIDAVMVSHIDEDHIKGVLDLFAALRDADDRQKPRPYDVRWLLHNSFDALLGEGEGGAARGLGGDTILASLGGLDALKAASGDADDHTAELVLQSYAQGSQLTTRAAALGIIRNPPDQAPLAFVGQGAKARVLRIGEASLTIVGPLQSEIDDLRKAWEKWRRKADKKPSELASYLDESVPNLSSIVVLLERGQRRLLLTGDARGDMILKGLEHGGFLPAGGTMKVDLLKLPHHGSIRNIDLDMLQRIEADHYVASGDGVFGNPDRETLDLIEKARPAGGYTVHLTYPAAQVDATHAEWRRMRGKPALQKGKHTIADVVERWRKEGKITVKEGPVRIDF